MLSDHESSVAECLPTGNDEDDQQSEASIFSSRVSMVMVAEPPREGALSTQGLVLGESVPPPDVEGSNLSNEDESMESNHSSCKLFLPSKEVQKPHTKRSRQQQDLSESGGKLACPVPLGEAAAHLIFVRFRVCRINVRGLNVSKFFAKSKLHFSFLQEIIISDDALHLSFNSR